MATKLLKTTIRDHWNRRTFSVTLPCLTAFYNDAEADPVERFSKVIFVDFSRLLAAYYDYPKDTADAVALYIAEKIFTDARCFWDAQYTLGQFVSELQGIGEKLTYDHASRKRVVGMVPLMERINKYRQINTP